MSVSLYPVAPRPKTRNSVNICNGHWAALVEMARAFGEDVDWNYCHDGQRYTPAQLLKIAERLDQIKEDGKWLRWLAANGGARLQ